MQYTERQSWVEFETLDNALLKCRATKQRVLGMSAPKTSYYGQQFCLPQSQSKDRIMFGNDIESGYRFL